MLSTGTPLLLVMMRLNIQVESILSKCIYFIVEVSQYTLLRSWRLSLTFQWRSYHEIRVDQGYALRNFIVWKGRLEYSWWIVVINLIAEVGIITAELHPVALQSHSHFQLDIFPLEHAWHKHIHSVAFIISCYLMSNTWRNSFLSIDMEVKSKRTKEGHCEVN
jgi:hypothetical protein